MNLRNKLQRKERNKNIMMYVCLIGVLPLLITLDVIVGSTLCLAQSGNICPSLFTFLQAKG